MAIHSGIRDDGVRFQIVPSTRKITVPQSHKVIGTVGSHNSEQLTFQCPKTIDGHDIVNCSDHYIDWVNADGKDGRYIIKREDITTDDENMYFTWAVNSSVTAFAGYIKFAVHFEDIDEDGSLLYEWGTTECSECQILGTIRSKSGTTVPIPDGYLKPTGKLGIIENGEYDVTPYESVDVKIPEPGGITVLTHNGIYNVKDYAEAQVSVANVVPEGYIKPLGRKEITSNGEHDVYSYESVKVSVQPKLQEKTTKQNTTVTPDSGYDGLSKVTVNVQPNLQEKTAKGNGEIIADSGYDGLSKVIVDIPEDIPEYQNKTATENGTYTADDGYDGLSSVTVDVQPKLQEKTIYPSESEQTVQPDSGYDGLSEVNVSAMRLQDKTITENGTVIPDSGYDGLSRVSINVEPKLQEKSVTRRKMDVIPDSGYYGLSRVSVDVELNLQEKTVTTNGTVTPSSDYDGLSKVTVNVPSDKKPEVVGNVENLNFSSSETYQLTPDNGKVFSYVKIQKPVGLEPEYIKKGVTICGITGTFDGYDITAYMYIGGSSKTSITADDVKEFGFTFTPSSATQECKFSIASAGYIYIVFPSNKTLNSITMDTWDISSDLEELKQIVINNQGYTVYKTKDRQAAGEYTYYITLR